MKTLNISIADDGTRFDSASDCQKYEALCHRVKVATIALGSEHDVPSMSYWQHEPSNVALAWECFYELCKAELGELIPWLTQKTAAEVHPASYLGRALSESGRKCLSDAGYRFRCIDAGGREFDQPFWANYRKDQTLDKHKKMNP